MIPARPFLWLSRPTAISLPPSWPPYLSPGWIAAYLAGAIAWLAIYELGGAALVAVIALLGVSLAVTAVWWLHTQGDREARAWQRRWRELGRSELPQAQVRRLGRGRR